MVSSSNSTAGSLKESAPDDCNARLEATMRRGGGSGEAIVYGKIKPKKGLDLGGIR